MNTRLAQTLFAFGISLPLAAIGWWIFAPLPVPAGTALLAGLAAFHVSSHEKWKPMVLGCLGGALIGSAVHYYQHAVENRIDVEGGLMAHLAIDAALGTAIALVILFVAVTLSTRIAGRAKSAA